MSIIGNPITLGGGGKPIITPSGYLLNNGVWSSDVYYGLYSNGDTSVSEPGGFVRVYLPNKLIRSGGVAFGPIRFGGTFTMNCVGATGEASQASARNTRMHLSAILDSKSNFVIRWEPGDYTTATEISKLVDLNGSASGSITLDTSSFSGQVGYLFGVLAVGNWQNVRSDARIYSVIAN